MNDTKELLQRARSQFPPPEGVMESLRRRRDRKRRNQRIAAGVVGIAVFVAAVWIVTSGGVFDRSETSVVPGGDVTRPAETVPQPLVEPVPIGTVTQSGAGCALELDAGPIPSGFTLTLANETNRPVSFELWRLRSRSSFAQLEAFVEAYDADGSWPIVPGPGGVSFGEKTAPGLLLRRGWFEREVGPGASGTITDNFTTGDAFAVVCLEPSSPDFLGQPYTPFAVVGPIVVP